MGSTAPPGDGLSPLYEYSSDLSGDYPGGLALRHKGTGCSTSYAAADASNPDVAGKWSVHAWSTGKLPQLFHLSRLVTLSLFTTTLGGTPGPEALRDAARPPGSEWGSLGPHARLRQSRPTG